MPLYTFREIAVVYDEYKIEAGCPKEGYDIYLSNPPEPTRVDTEGQRLMEVDEDGHPLIYVSGSIKCIYCTSPVVMPNDNESKDFLCLKCGGIFERRG